MRRVEFMTKEKTLKVVGCHLAPAKCDYCFRDADIEYSLSHRGMRLGDGTMNPEYNSVGRNAYCKACCEHLAIGMLRDVAELEYGERNAAHGFFQKMLGLASYYKQEQP